MKIKYYGHASFLITSKKDTKIVTDPYKPGCYDGGIKYGSIPDKADIVLMSHDHDDHNYSKGVGGNPQIINKSGSYSIKDIEIDGVTAYHDTSKGKERGANIIFYMKVDGVIVCHAGDLGEKLSDSKVSEIGVVDVLLVPVGGFFTIDADGATDTLNKLKPRIVIPMHYKTDKCGFPIATVDEFLKGKARVKKLDLSEIEIEKDKLPKETEIIVLKYSL